MTAEGRGESSFLGHVVPENDEELELLLDHFVKPRANPGDEPSWDAQTRMIHQINSRQQRATEISLTESPKAAVDYYRNLA